MTAATSMQGDPRPRSYTRHTWRCVRRGPLLQTVRRSPNGEALTVEQCGECGGTDLEHRLRTEAERAGAT